MNKKWSDVISDEMSRKSTVNTKRPFAVSFHFWSTSTVLSMVHKKKQKKTVGQNILIYSKNVEP